MFKMLIKMHSINQFDKTLRRTALRTANCVTSIALSISLQDSWTPPSGILNSCHSHKGMMKNWEMVSLEIFPVTSMSPKPTEIQINHSRMVPVNESEYPRLLRNHKFVVYCNESFACLFLFRCSTSSPFSYCRQDCGISPQPLCQHGLSTRTLQPVCSLYSPALSATI